MDKRKVVYYVNSNEVSFELYTKLLCWSKNSELCYKIVENYDCVANTLYFILHLRIADLVAFMERMADYNERLEQRLNKLA